ncbi:hypothetical protein ETD86_29610 [Nonomuraea turkmeniaca]|uniref:Uncharacterized protein n=1 Tax=Nonomuraea turkmeniaca TaxID=103838 RepID=A0A5S4FAK9_9ACTN|nr:hypothetical protein [Nonomuraea turkmeniaca]TMR14105.1 hypothetical protein ETD86_29610 [Nonomuraea turkmeniaca]
MHVEVENGADVDLKALDDPRNEPEPPEPEPLPPLDVEKVEHALGLAQLESMKVGENVAYVLDAVPSLLAALRAATDDQDRWRALTIKRTRYVLTEDDHPPAPGLRCMPVGAEFADALADKYEADEGPTLWAQTEYKTPWERHIPAPF